MMNLPIGKINRDQTAQLELRRTLLECLEKEQTELRSILDEFYELPRRTEDDYARVNQKIIEILDHVISAGDWDSSMFLKNTIKPIKERRTKAEVIKQELESEGVVAEQTFSTIKPENAVTLYVLLYQAEGMTLSKWEAQLKSIMKVSQGRPIYHDLEKVGNALRAKLNRNSEAYVKVLVDKNDLIDSARMSRDRFGNELVTVTVTAIRPENIIEFVHQNKHYQFKNGKLKLKE